jgi:capsular exopolysaccharide synthesis family protein
VATTLNEKQTELILRQEEAERLTEALREEGIEIKEEAEEEGPVQLRLVGTGNGTSDLDLILSENLAILAQPMVEASQNVSSLRRRVRQRRDDRDRILARFTPTSDEVKEVEEYILTARRQLGKEVKATIVRYVRAGRDLDDVIEKLEQRLEAKQEAAKELNESYARIALAREKVTQIESELERIRRERETLANLSEEPSAGPLAIQNIRIERRARIKDTPRIRPNTMMIILLTAFAAVFLAFGSAFLVEFLDDTVKTKEEFERFVGVPDIGFIPRISEKDFKKKDTAVIEKPRSGVAEAFRSIRTGILFSRRDEEIQRLLISSAGPGEGKTTIATNLAITMADAGRGKVLLIDADLRKARVHTALGVKNTVGLTNCLVGGGTLADAVRPTEVKNLHVLTSGPTPPNPAELLGGHRMAEILDEAAKEYSKIIIDTPPLVAVTDTCLLAPLVDGIFLVISMGKTSWRLIDRAKQSLSAVGEEVTGAIVNDVRSTGRGYGYGYGYGYGRYHRYYGVEEE